MITTNNIRKITIVVLVLLLTACKYDNNISVVSDNILDGETNISLSFELTDGHALVKVNSVRGFPQLQTK